MTAWIFQGNPKLFDVDTYLARERNVLWGANQGFTMMKAGDVVYFWRSRGDGADYPGIIASGVMTEEPREQPGDPASAPYWRGSDGGDGRQVAIRVEVPAGQRLLPSAYLAEHSELQDLEILKVPNATNFRVGTSREEVLSSAWEGAKSLSTTALLVESLASSVRDWRGDASAQAHLKDWTEGVQRARQDLARLFRGFIRGTVSLAALRSEFDNRTRWPLWSPLGLAGPNGAMVLNKWTKHFPEEEMTERLINLLPAPEGADDGRARLLSFQAYLLAKINSGDLQQGQTGLARMPSFISAIWQALEEGNARWPTLYTSARDALLESQVLLKRDDAIQIYFEFRELVLGIERRFELSVDEVHKLLLWMDNRVDPDLPLPPVRPPPPPTGSPARRVWLMSPGAGAINWEAWKQDGIAAIGWNDLGNLLEYPSVESVAEALKERYGATNPVNNRWACFEFARTMQAGDTIFVKGGMHRVLGLGTIVGDYRYDPSRSPEHHVRQVKWLDTSAKTLPGLNLTVKTLTDISQYSELVDTLQGLYRKGDDDSGVATSTPTTPEPDLVDAYTLAEASRELFLNRELVEDMLVALRTKKNLILQGPPGVGKTFVAKRLAYLLMEQKAEDQLSLVQFHQSYSYEDFIQGFRPTATGGFHRENGPFFRFCELARQDPRSPYVLIIDEINRGNVSRIFGELLMLLEADKRGPEWAVQLSYGTAGDAPFYVPANVHVIGTMNTADRSLALVDYALRRRFAFLDVPPGFDSTEFGTTLKALGVPTGVGDRIRSVMDALNHLIEKDPNLGIGYLIGHSYFCDGTSVVRDEDWLERVFRMELEPLLREYFRDTPHKLNEAQKLLERL